MSRSKDLFTKYDLPTKTCVHALCDGEICILNPIHMRDVLEWKYVSCLYVPMMGGFRRLKGTKKVVTKGKPQRMAIYYIKRVKKGKHVKLWNGEDVFDFIQKYHITLTVDLFTFNPKINCELTMEKHIWWKKCMVEDVSNGQEVLQIPAVNLVDEEVPVIDEYVMTSVFSNDRTCSKRTHVCCDCEDNCKDKLKCACFLETLKCYNPEERKLLKKDENIGYDYKRLPFARQNLSGIYECNSKCHCTEQCLNRVVQFPPKWKVQLFKDEEIKEKGWGVRTLNDIPTGSFVGVYTGTMSQESQANLKCSSAEWLTAGKWKYIVNLQVMQNAMKETVKIKPRIEPKNRPTKQLAVKTMTLIPQISFGYLNFKKVFSVPQDVLGEDNVNLNQSKLYIETAKSLSANLTNRQMILEFLEAKIKKRIPTTSQTPVNQEIKKNNNNIIKKTKQFLTYTSTTENFTYKIPDNLRFNLVSRKRKLLVAKKKGQSSANSTASPTLPLPRNDETVPDKYLPVVKLSNILMEIKKFKADPFIDDNDENKPAKKGANEIKLQVIEAKTEEVVDKGKEETIVLDAVKPIRGRQKASKPTATVTPQQHSTRCKRTLPPPSSPSFAIASGSKAVDTNNTAKMPRLELSPNKGQSSMMTRSDECSPPPPSQAVKRKKVTSVSASRVPPSQNKLPMSPIKNLAMSPIKNLAMSPVKNLQGSPLKKAASKVKGKYALRQASESKNYTFKQYDHLLRAQKHSKVQPKIKVSKDLYLIDGRKKGNIGRYLNHSCDPNVYCQYVFVETHDVRFPVVAFFAIKDIKAGTELTWSYNYDDDCDMGIDPLECKCGAENCRGILIC